MQFGVFDHVDRNDLSLADFYDTRLRLISELDQLGFDGYHVAEHHFTPLGMAPSPSVYLASAIQRTSRIRIGSLVHTLPLYHPMRLAEEICMLDQMSRGRLDFGVGRGISPIESAYYGAVPDREVSRQVYQESLDLILQAFTEKVVNFDGVHRKVDGAPMELSPFQSPHPPLWMGVQTAENADFAARYRMNMACILDPPDMKKRVDDYRASYLRWHGEQPSTEKMALSFFIVVAEDDKAALEIARPSYKRWFQSFNHLYRLHNKSPMLGERADNFDDLQRLGRGVAGSTETVSRFLSDRARDAGVNYVIGQFFFGDMSYEVASNSIRLFADRVMPQVASAR